jgi:hypothetical protein
VLDMMTLGLKIVRDLVDGDENLIKRFVFDGERSVTATVERDGKLFTVSLIENPPMLAAPAAAAATEGASAEEPKKRGRRPKVTELERQTAAPDPVDGNGSPVVDQVEADPNPPRPAAPEIEVKYGHLPTKERDELRLIDAKDRLRAAIDRVTELGGRPMHILGMNPHNVLETSNSHVTCDEYAYVLEQWSPTSPSTVQMAPFRDGTPPPSDEDRRFG